MLSIVVLEKTPESPLEYQEIKPVHPKLNQPWIFIGRTDAEAEAPILWPPDGKSWFIRNDSDAGKDWREGDKRGWDGWMASPTRWTWVWVDSGSWRWTGWPGVLRFIGSQRVVHDWVTELNWTEFTLILGPNIPGSYAILLFTALDLTSIASHIHNWALFSLWLCSFWSYFSILLQ